MLQIITTIVFFVVFLQLFVCCNLFIYITLRRYIREGKQQQKEEQP